MPHCIPGTPKFQPADVGLQRIAKHQIKTSATDFMVARASTQLAAGVAPEAVQLPTDLPTLRNASVAWLVDTYKYFVEHPDVVKMAWEKSTAGENDQWNLSYASLTSSTALERLRVVTTENHAFGAQLLQFDPLHSICGPLGEDEPPSDISEHDDDICLTTDQVQLGVLGDSISLLESNGVEVGSDGELCVPIAEANGDFEEVEVSEDTALHSLSQASTDTGSNSDNVCPFFLFNSESVFHFSQSYSDSDIFCILFSQTHDVNQTGESRQDAAVVADSDQGLSNPGPTVVSRCIVSFLLIFLQ